MKRIVTWWRRRRHRSHWYKWSEVKAERHGGPPPRCSFCRRPAR